MSFDLESIGGGFGSGIIGAFLGILGINRRMKKLENCKQDKTTCIPLHRGIDEKFTMIVDIQKAIREDQKCIRERVDSLSDYLRNKKND